MIRDDLVIETKSFKDFGEEQGSNSRGVKGFLGRAENYPLSKPMVNHNQKGSKPSERGRSVIRSQEICWNRQEQEDRIGRSGGQDRCVLTLFCWQVVQPWT